MATIYDLDTLLAENTNLKQELAQVNGELVAKVAELEKVASQSMNWKDFAMQLRLALKKVYEDQRYRFEIDTFGDIECILDATHELEGEKPWYISF